ncbi:hypothetical protein BH11PSE3_BH11PSE3_31640 [soil metagenome]
MATRRSIFVAVAATLSMAAILDYCHPKAKRKVMLANASRRGRGPANRSLAALEDSWTTTRCHLDAMMEDGRVPRDLWEKAKLNVIHGNFDIRDPNNGDLLVTVVNGVRVATPPPSGPRLSPVH